MSNTNDGGPAFPLFTPDGHYNGSVSEPGMSFRDYLAAHAPFVLSDVDDFYRTAGKKGKSYREAIGTLAAISYEYADAMLAARKP